MNIIIIGQHYEFKYRIIIILEIFMNIFKLETKNSTASNNNKIVIKPNEIIKKIEKKNYIFF